MCILLQYFFIDLSKSNKCYAKTKKMTKLSKILGDEYSHDRFTKKLLLNDEIETDKELWQSVKPILRKYVNE